MDQTAPLATSAIGAVTEVVHPLVQHKLGLMRDVSRRRSFPAAPERAQAAPHLRGYPGPRRRGGRDRDPARADVGAPDLGEEARRCPILRAGIGMLDAVLSLVPGARVGFIGLFRDEETLEPVEYYVKLPGDIADRDVILLDPMLATGNSTAAAIETVKRAGATSVRLIALIAAPEGIAVSIATISTCASWSRPSTGS